MQIYFGLFLILFVTVSLAAPTKKESEDAAAPLKDSSNTAEVENEESALQNLVSAAGKPHDEAFMQSHSVSFSNVNGDKVTSEEGHKKVVEDGKLVSDLKEHVTNFADEKNVPHKVVETEVDIPEQGVHKTLTSVDDNPPKETPEDTDEESFVQLSPTDVASYLLETYDFEKFERVLNASSMSDEEAKEYRAAVQSEFNRLLEEYMDDTLYGNGDIADPDEFNQQLYDDRVELPERRSMPAYTDDAMIEDLPLYGDERDYLFNKVPFLANEEEGQYPAYNAEDELNGMIRNVIKNWLFRAITTGDRQDEALVANIARLVANDDDPNDEEQVKEGLEDLVAQSILDELAGLDFDPSFVAKQVDEQLPPVKQTESAEESEETPSESDKSESRTEDEKTPESEGNLENDLKETVQNHRM